MNSPLNEDEEFEFRLRMEQEAAPQQQKEIPSMLSVVGNAAAKGLANVADIAGNVPYALIPPGLRPEAMNKPARQGLTAAGLIRPENEPQTAGQRLADVAVQSGVGMLANPVKGGLDVAKNVATGIVGGLSAQATKEATGSDLLAVAVGLLSPMALNRLAAPGTPLVVTPTAKDTLKAAQDAGYVVQPATVKPSFGVNRLESVAGKAAVAQEAALRNQTITNNLAAKAIGLPEGSEITPAALESVRARAGQVYQEVEALRPTTEMEWFPRYHDKNLFEQLKQARADATTFWKSYNRSADPAVMKQAKAYDATAKSIEQDLERIATAAGKPDLIERMKAARQLFARTYDIEQVLNVGSNNVSGAMIGRMLDRGHPFTGELKVIGKFAQAFPRVMRDAESLPPPSTSGVDAASSAILGGIGYGAAGGPTGLLAAGLPLLRGPARSAALSNMMQKRLLREPSPLAQSLYKGALIGRSVMDYQDAIKE